MEIKWFKNADNNLYGSVSKNNITLNRACHDFFADYAFCKLGYSSDDKVIVVKPIAYDLIESNQIDFDAYKVYINKSYIRISATNFINEINNVFNEQFTTVPRKFRAIWNDKHSELYINLKDEVIGDE